jgi:hypothetical protein
MQSKFNQKTIDAYQLNAISYIEKLIEDIFSDSFANEFIEHSNYQYEKHKKIDESKGVKHDDVCDCRSFDYLTNELDPVIEYLKPHKKALLKFENLFEDMIGIIIDKGLNPQISIDYLDIFRNDPDYFSEIFLKSEYGCSSCHRTIGNEEVLIVAPNVTNKDKEKSFLANYL